jgi:protein arginine kinase activator
MMCESCQENLATVHLTEIVQKTKKETHLCESCARDKGVSYTTEFSVKDFLGGLSKKVKPPEKVAAAAAAEPVVEPCPSCGITFAEFRQTGRLGCHNDYEHFQESLLPLLRKIHNTQDVQHTGRVPSQLGERLERGRRIAGLRNELEEAVARENYERAAELRDRIKSLEDQPGDDE